MRPAYTRQIFFSSYLKDKEALESLGGSVRSAIRLIIRYYVPTGEECETDADANEKTHRMLVSLYPKHYDMLTDMPGTKTSTIRYMVKQYIDGKIPYIDTIVKQLDEETRVRRIKTKEESIARTERRNKRNKLKFGELFFDKTPAKKHPDAKKIAEINYLHMKIKRNIDEQNKLKRFSMMKEHDRTKLSNITTAYN